jgi:hypothetical protein
MTHNLKYLFRGITLAVFMSTTVLHAQVLKDSTSLNLINKGIDNIYNFRFADAKDILNKLRNYCPDHPINSLLSGILVYWENYPLLPASSFSSLFENKLHQCIELCEKKTSKENEAEYLLINLCARSMLLLYYSDNDLTSEVFPLTLSTYQYLRKSFNFTDVYPDFFFFTGLYNYYREAYPEAYPVYKTMAFLFPKGSKNKGLKELQKAAKNSIFLKADSYSFLASICIYFENDYQNACIFNVSLHRLYPENIQYQTLYIKNLLLLKEYDKAEGMMRDVSSRSGNVLFQAQLAIFNGILQEKKYHDYVKALDYYNNGVRDIAVFGHYANDFASYGYYGLSRISEINGDKRGKKIYHKKALELSDFKKINFEE